MDKPKGFKADFMLEEEKPKLCEVEIEVEEIISETSEEDAKPDEALTSILRNTKSGSNRGSVENGSVAELHQSSRLKKKVDPLKIFEQKLRQKFQEKIKEQMDREDKLRS